MYMALCSFYSAHVRERDKALLRSVMVGGVWSGFLLAGFGGSPFHVASVVLLTVMVIFLGNVPFPRSHENG